MATATLQKSLSSIREQAEQKFRQIAIDIAAAEDGQENINLEEMKTAFSESGRTSQDLERLVSVLRKRRHAIEALQHLEDTAPTDQLKASGELSQQLEALRVEHEGKKRELESKRFDIDSELQLIQLGRADQRRDAESVLTETMSPHFQSRIASLRMWRFYPENPNWPSLDLSLADCHRQLEEAKSSGDPDAISECERQEVACQERDEGRSKHDVLMAKRKQAAKVLEALRDSWSCTDWT